MTPRRSLLALALLCLTTLARAEAAPYVPAPRFPQLPPGVKLGAVSGVATADGGNVFVFHRGEKPILAFDGTGKFLLAFGDGLFDSAHGLRVDPAGNVWATDNANHTVVKFTADGKVLLTVGERGVPGDDETHFDKPTDVAVTPGGDFYVSDGYGNSRVVKFDKSGKFIRAWGRKGAGDGEFNLPHAVRLDSKGNVYVADRENRRVQVFDGDGKFLRQFAQGIAPYGLFVTADDRIFIADGVAHFVYELDAAGKVLAKWGGGGREAGKFLLPHAVDVGRGGEVYVAEVTGTRVQKFVRREAAEPRARYESPADARPECGHGLTPEMARAGWISLFDGQTAFGWTDAEVRGGQLTAGSTSVPFGDLEVRADIGNPGNLSVGRSRLPTGSGTFDGVVKDKGTGPIELTGGASARTFCVRPALPPLAIKPGEWEIIPHPTLGRERQTSWKPIERDGRVLGFRAVGGPGCLELPGRFGDFVLQVDVLCRKPLTNAGVFFRSRPGDFLNGYEAQVFNGCVGGDATTPARWCTGAIDDRQNARRLVSRDGEPFTLTIVAAGRQFATWVNGVQVTDWADPRTPHDNPRRGVRLEPGTIQLQAHDRETDVEFTNIRIAPLK